MAAVRLGADGPERTGKSERRCPRKHQCRWQRRERLRDHQAAAAKAVGAHGAAMARLEAVISRRADVLAAQDSLVAAANAEVAAAVVTAAEVMGVDVAASLLDLTKAEVRRMRKAEKSPATEAKGRLHGSRQPESPMGRPGSWRRRVCGRLNPHSGSAPQCATVASSLP